MKSNGVLLVSLLMFGTGALVSCRQSNLVGGPLPPDNPGAVTSLPSIPNQALNYRAALVAPPKVIDTDRTTDAPLMGNGDLGVAIFGGIDAMTFNLHKNEFWSLGEGRVKAMERMTLAIPGMPGASYAMTEELGLGQVTGTFAAGGRTITTKSWVQADDTTTNRVITQLTLTGGGSLAATVTLAIGHDNTYASAGGATSDVLYRDARADAGDTIGGQATRRVRVATRVVGAAGSVAGDALTFTLTSDAPVWLVAGVMSNLDDVSYQSRVVDSIASLGAGDVTALEAAHRSWWDRFYRKSFIEIPDKVLEKHFYAALYLLGSASRAGEQAPGLWANWVMRDPGWNGDYGLDYNYEVPYYAAFPTNHVELAENFDQPIIDWLPNARAEATRLGWTGAYYRSHIGPLPNGSADTIEWNQKFNGAFAASVMINHYQATRDLAYAASIYETLKEMSTFWQDYLKSDGARYVVYSDPQHQGGTDPQVNGVMCSSREQSTSVRRWLSTPTSVPSGKRDWPSFRPSRHLPETARPSFGTPRLVSTGTRNTRSGSTTSTRQARSVSIAIRPCCRPPATWSTRWPGGTTRTAPTRSIRPPRASVTIPPTCLRTSAPGCRATPIRTCTFTPAAAASRI